MGKKYNELEAKPWRSQIFNFLQLKTKKPPKKPKISTLHRHQGMQLKQTCTQRRNLKRSLSKNTSEAEEGEFTFKKIIFEQMEEPLH